MFCGHIPTAIEAGLPGMELQVFNGLFAPAKTPAAVISKISLATQQALSDASFTE
jgi:tripartite-type tricarboxylate transporter receptor subunit TctC